MAGPPPRDGAACQWGARPHTVKVQYPDRGLSKRGAPAPVPSVRPVRPYPRYAGTFGKTFHPYRHRGRGEARPESYPPVPLCRLSHPGRLHSRRGCQRGDWVLGCGQVHEGCAELWRQALAKLLSMIVRCHYLYKHLFIRPSIEDVVKRYNEKHHPKLGTAGAAAGAELAAADGPTTAAAVAQAAAAAALAAGADPAAATAAALAAGAAAAPGAGAGASPL